MSALTILMKAKLDKLFEGQYDHRKPMLLKSEYPEFVDQHLRGEKSYLEQRLRYKEVYHNIIYNPKKTKQTNKPHNLNAKG